MAAVQTLEVVDAHGVGAVGDSFAQRCLDVLRMVCGAISVVLDISPNLCQMSNRVDLSKSAKEILGK